MPNATIREEIARSLRANTPKTIEQSVNDLLRHLSAAGYVIVPKEATEAMADTARATAYRDGSFSMYVVWSAMLAAAEKDGA
ncbi:MAG TPA: hypothetical protein VG983_11420 [Caulobacterales bacterium]|nr:hypothetical protein [Caulobacterales bacterium]